MNIRLCTSRELEIFFWNASFLLFLIAALFFSLPVKFAAASGLNYVGTFEESELASGEYSFRQTHNVGLGLSQEAGNFIQLSENVRYTKTQQDSFASNERLFQSVDFVDSNELFRAHLSGSATSGFVDGQKQVSSESIEAGFRGGWDNIFPVLAVVLNRSTTLNNAISGSHKDTGVTTLDTTVEWGWWSAVDFYYNYKITEPDATQGVLRTLESHSSQLSFTDSYWQNKLRVRINQDYARNSQKIDATSTSVALPVLITEIRTGVDTTPLDNSESTVINNLMRDGNLVAPGYNVVSGTSFNNFLLVINGQQINQVFLYTQTAFTGVPAGLNWTLYTNDLLGTSWVDSSSLITGVSYNVAQKRFEIDIVALSANYIKIGLDHSNLAGPVIDFTEVAVFNGTLVSTAFTDQNSSSSTTLSLSAALSRKVSVGYSGSYNTIKLTGVNSIKTDDSGHSVSLGYSSPEQKITSTLSAGLAIKDDYVSRSYSGKIGKEFLPTLYASCNWDRRETYFSSEMLSETTTYGVSSSAQLYPDLATSIALTADESRDFAGTNKPTAKSISFDLDITARLGPSLTAFFYENMDQKREPAGEKSFLTGGTFSWQIARPLSLNVNAENVKQDGKPGLSSGSSAINLALSRQILLSMSYNYAEVSADVNRQAGNASVRWAIKRGVGFSGNVAYTKKPENIQTLNEVLVSGQLTVNFQVP